LIGDLLSAQSNYPITPLPDHSTRSIILFDGVCNLCNGFVQFVIARDRSARFSFASLQSDAAARLLARTTATGSRGDSIVLLDRGRLFTQSTAALRIARELGFPWTLAYILVGVPRPLRDWVYDVVARNRYRWFGKRDVCFVPTPDLKRRFLE
jgi:predicted DCC family thiol-disulfide oxidoreductase YuxK